jgi:hypothetical protein
MEEEMLEWTGERKEDYMNIKELIEKEESETLEFKERFKYPSKNRANWKRDLLCTGIKGLIKGS